MSNGNSSKFRDITNPHYWGQDLQCMNMRYLQKCCNVLWPEVSNNRISINDGRVVMYLKYQMGVIGIGALMSRCAEIWETESVLLAELQVFLWPKI